MGELGAQPVEDGTALLGIAPRRGEIATDDVPSVADFDLLGLELGELARNPRHDQRDKGRLIINHGAAPFGTAALAHAEDVFELAFLQRGKERGSATYKQAVQTFFDRAQFLLMVREWILFYLKEDELEKTILRQHQTRAALKVVERCADPVKKAGLIWHTQGSGKTFTLITAGRLILENSRRFPGATVMLVVDRNELEGQLSGWVDRLLREIQGRQIKTNMPIRAPGCRSFSTRTSAASRRAR